MVDLNWSYNGFGNQMSGSSDQITQANIDASRAMSRAQLFGDVASLGGKLYGYASREGVKHLGG
jgi:hypothetical protein